MTVSPQQFEVANRHLFARWARWYDSSWSRLIFFEPTYRRIILLLTTECANTFHSGARVLDIACGTGEIIHRLAGRYERVDFTGIDLTNEMLQKAKEKNSQLKNVHFKESSADKLSFPDEYFDLIVCTDAFHHFPFPEQTIAEMHRVLKRDGMVLLVDIAVNGKALQLLGKFLKPLEHAHRYYGRKELEQLMTGHHFKLRSIFTYYFNNYCLAKK